MKLTDITDFLGFTDTKRAQGLEPEKGKIDRDDLGPRKVLLAWEGAPKVTKTSVDPRYKKTIMIIGGVIAFLLFLMHEFLLILVIASVYFISQALANNPVGIFKYEVSTHGIAVNGKLYYWDEMLRFFFSGHFGDEYLAVDLKEGLPARLIIGFKKEDRKKIIEALNKYIIYLEEEPLTFVDKAYKQVIDKFDLEKKK